MKELREKIEKMKVRKEDFLAIKKGDEDYRKGWNEALNYALVLLDHYFKQTGKRGGETTKKQNPDYSALGKKGAANRWKKKKYEKLVV